MKQRNHVFIFAALLIVVILMQFEYAKPLTANDSKNKTAEIDIANDDSNASVPKASEITSNKSARTITMQVGNPMMIVDNKLKEISPEKKIFPVMSADKTFVPVKPLVEEFGGTILFTERENKYTISFENRKIELFPNKKTYIINGNTIEYDRAPIIVGRTVFIPTKFLVDNTPFKVSFDSATETLTITNPKVNLQNPQFIPYTKTALFGTNTPGGFNGKVIRVTNLNSSGEGSLRAAIDSAGPRIVVFDVGGVINLGGSDLEINNSHITIVGQTAPAPGITIIGGTVKVKTHNVVISNIACRLGNVKEGNENSGYKQYALDISGRDAINVVVENCSISWGNKANVYINGRNIALYNCIVAECLTNNSEDDSNGVIIDKESRNIGVYGCLLANNVRGNPLIKAQTNIVFSNNVVYNSKISSILLDVQKRNDTDKEFEYLFSGNAWLTGNDSNLFTPFISLNSKNIPNVKIFANDNISRTKEGESLKDADLELDIMSPSYEPTTKIDVLTAFESVHRVLNTAGVRPGARDLIDLRIMKDVIEDKGRILGSIDDVGGYPNYDAVFKKCDEIPSGYDKRMAWYENVSLNCFQGDVIDTSKLNIRLISCKPYEVKQNSFRINMPSWYVALSDIKVTDSFNSQRWSLINNIHQGDFVYGDNDDTFKELPAEFIGLDLIRPSFYSKYAKSTPLITFKSNKTVEVFVAFDSSCENPASWLNDWEATDEKITTVKGITYNVYRKQFLKDSKVELGANEDRFGMQYFILVKDPESKRQSIANIVKENMPTPTPKPMVAK